FPDQMDNFLEAATITFRPRKGWLSPPTKPESSGEATPEQDFLPLSPIVERLPVVIIVAFRHEPRRQPLPLADQTFVADIDGGVAGRSSVGQLDVGGEKLTSLRPECRNHLRDVGAPLDATDLDEGAVFRRSSHRVRYGRTKRDRLKHAFRRSPFRGTEVAEH